MFTFRKNLKVSRNTDGGSLFIKLDQDVIDAFGIEGEGEEVTVVVTGNTAMMQKKVDAASR